MDSSHSGAMLRDSEPMDALNASSDLLSLTKMLPAILVLMRVLRSDKHRMSFNLTTIATKRLT